MGRKIGVQGFSPLTHQIAISPIWRVNVEKKKKKNLTWRYHIALCNKSSLSLCPKKSFRPDSFFSLVLFFSFLLFFFFLVHFSPVFSFKCCFFFLILFFPHLFYIFVLSLSLSLSQCSALHFFNKSIICYFLYLIGVW